MGLDGEVKCESIWQICFISVGLLGVQSDLLRVHKVYLLALGIFRLVSIGLNVEINRSLNSCLSLFFLLFTFSFIRCSVIYWLLGTKKFLKKSLNLARIPMEFNKIIFYQKNGMYFFSIITIKLLLKPFDWYRICNTIS